MNHRPEDVDRNLLSRFPEAAPAVEACRSSADPQMALRNLARYLESAKAPPTDPRRAALLFSGSQSLSDAVCRVPAILELATRTEESSRRAFAARVEERLTKDPPNPTRALRTFVKIETLRVLLDDLSGEAGLDVVTKRLSQIAEATIHAALNLALLEVSKAHGRPTDSAGEESTLTVIGLGKLGGAELNYSSDVDVLFLYSAEGHTSGGAGLEPLTNRAFFAEVVKRTRLLLAETTEDGRCYRVDLRLRPEGSAGGLTRSVSSAIAYYRRLGRTWERQALIKARPVGGDRELGRTFVSAVSDFVYGTPLAMDDIARMQQLKRRIESRGSELEVKSGPGGIRDVEFTVQFLQLLNGAEYSRVRLPGTLPALRALRAVGALTGREEAALRDSYVFLRRVEHRLQTLYEVRTHTIPSAPEAMDGLARRLGLRGGEDSPRSELMQVLAIHTTQARAILDRLFKNLFLEKSPELARISDYVLSPTGREEAVTRWLSDHGFTDPPAALAAMRDLAGDHPRARKFFASLCPRLLARAAETPDPDRCLRNLGKILSAYQAPATFYQLLSEHPDILAVFADLSGWSQALSDLLIRSPGRLDAFVDSLVVAPGGNELDPERERERVAGSPDPRRLLEEEKALALLRIGVRDVQGKANTQNTSADLTSLAERILSLALAWSAAEETRREGGSAPRLAVIGLGKLGSEEMSYASDLDLFFVSEAGAGSAGAAGLSRTAQRTVRLLTTAGEHGRIYEVDTRVRPFGRGGALVTSLSQLAPYYRESARVAELQMLTKARFVAGDEGIGRRAEEIVADVLYGRPPRSGIPGEVRRMRRALERTSRGLDVKRGPGGIVDIEFLVECLKLVHGHRVPALRVRGTFEGLAAAHAAALIESRELDALLTAAQFLRSVESRIRIVYDMSLERIPDEPAERNRLARRLGYVDAAAGSAGDALLAEYEYHTKRTRQVFLEVLEKTEEGSGKPTADS